MKRWLNQVFDKKNKSILPSTIITMAIIAMLVISGPAQAVQVTLNAQDLQDRIVGETGVFYVNVTIGSNERIPITNISVEGLPEIDGSPDGVLVFKVGDFSNVGDHKIKGNYDITLIEQIGFMSGYGYGYGYENNNNTPPFAGYGYSHQFFGYGYGYGDSPDNYTQLKYKVIMDTDGADPGTYNAVAKVNAGNDVNGQKVAFQGSFSFTLKEETPGTPAIKEFSPSSPVNDTAPAKETFRIRVNQTVNVTWYLDGMKKGEDKLVKKSNITLNTADIGVHNVTAVAENANGMAVQKWVWNVKSSPEGKLHASVKITPETIKLSSKGTFTAFITLPKGFDVRDIDVSSLMCEGAPAVKAMISKKDGGTLIAKFNRQDLDVDPGNRVVLTVKGKLLDGTEFEGSDTVNIIDKGKKEDDKKKDKGKKESNNNVGDINIINNSGTVNINIYNINYYDGDDHDHSKENESDDENDE